MPTPIREQVLAAFHAQVSTALSPVVVERNRSNEIQQDQSIYVLLVDGPQAKASDETAIEFYRMTVFSTGYIKLDTPTATDADIGPAMNALYADLLNAALSDHTLGGLSVDVREGDMREVYIEPGADHPTCMFELSFVIDYFTAAGDPFTIGP